MRPASMVGGLLHPGWWALGGAGALGLALEARRRRAGWERAALLVPLLGFNLAFPALLADSGSDGGLLARFLLVGIVSISSSPVPASSRVKPTISVHGPPSRCALRKW